MPSTDVTRNGRSIAAMMERTTGRGKPGVADVSSDMAVTEGRRRKTTCPIDDVDCGRDKEDGPEKKQKSTSNGLRT